MICEKLMLFWNKIEGKGMETEGWGRGRMPSLWIRQWFEELNRVLIQFGAVHPHPSIDEQMVPYFGHHFSAFWFQSVDTRIV